MLLEPLGRCGKIVEDVLFLELCACNMPILSVLAPAADIGLSKDSSLLQPSQSEGGERGF